VCPKLTTRVSLRDLTETAFVTGATHDIGKGTTFFQKYLSGHKKIDPLLKSHSMISSLFCSKCILDNPKISDNYRNFLAVASALVIQGHHGSLKRPISYLSKGLDIFDDSEIFLRQIKAFQSIEELERISENLGLESFVKFTKKWESHFCKFSKILSKSSSFAEKKFSDV
jgi:CRISPR-associated endonuclease Cas3-HD